MRNQFRSSVAANVRSAAIFTVSMAVLLAGTLASIAADLVTFQAESGTPGSNFTNGTDGAVQFISISTDTVNSGNPGNANRVATYSVTFPLAGTYELYGRVRVGPGGAADDSFFYGNGFGGKSLTSDADWILVNSVNVGGFTNPGDVVTGSGSAGITVWKWINLSEYTGTAGETPIAFTVTAGNLTQTFQIGGRENGLDMDKFAFGTLGTFFTVSNLDTGTLPATSTLTNTFTGPDGNALHRFNPLVNGLNLDGANPAAGLALSGGVLCGTTLNGGPQGAGTTFCLSLDGTNFNAFRSFTNQPDAGNPQGELAVSGTRFFGTTSGGGGSGSGTVFVGQTNGSVSLLRSFAAVSSDTATNSGGASPSASLALAGGTLYGTTTAGGAAANGTVFSLTTNGATFSVLHNFSLLDSPTGTNADGAAPWGGLILAGGKLYGTASVGGAGGNGVIFSVDPGGANFTTLHSFTPMDSVAATNTDGAMPLGGLVLSNNTLYGTTYAGGHGGRGAIFSVQTNGLGFAVLHHFLPVDSVAGTNTDGASPCAALTLSSNVLYGTASAGGTGAAGTVFSLNADGSRFNAFRSFSAVASNGTNRDGAFPVAPVLLLGNTVYGTAFSGGPGAAGTVFSIPLPAPPAVITNIVRNGNGSVTLYFLGAPNSTNVIQAATNLTPTIAWQNVSTNAADTNGAWQFTDLNTTGATRFYRSYAR
jgi:uncharacterized repeat protein (TIGR03803 family)